MTDTTTAAVDNSAALTAMKLPQLQALASELGVSGTAKMRKSDLVDAIQNGGAPVAAPKQAQAPAQHQSEDAAERARRAAIAVTEASCRTAARP